ncbi:MAG: hypothetical protein ABIQ44_15285, partial [Chloroflexia bacterium]
TTRRGLRRTTKARGAKARRQTHFKCLASIIGIAVVASACGPAEEAVRTTEDAARIAHETCDISGPIYAWSSERAGEAWIARHGFPDDSGCWQFTARINAADGKTSCEVMQCSLNAR